MRFLLAILLAVTPLGVLAQEDGSLRCLRAESIVRARPIDDSTIAFFLRNRRVYVNFLPRSCPGIARHQRIAWETRGRRLCRQDRVAVIFDAIGEDVGLPCPLGEFRRMDRETVELMIEAAGAGGATPPATAEPVELPPQETSEQERSAPGE